LSHSSPLGSERPERSRKPQRLSGS
jgi:hypothetical protein